MNKFLYNAVFCDLAIGTVFMYSDRFYVKVKKKKALYFPKITSCDCELLKFKQKTEVDAVVPQLPSIYEAAFAPKEKIDRMQVPYTDTVAMIVKNLVANENVKVVEKDSHLYVYLKFGDVWNMYYSNDSEYKSNMPQSVTDLSYFETSNTIR